MLAYCMKCKKQVKMLEVEEQKFPSGARGYSGLCACGAKVFRLGVIKDDNEQSQGS